MKEPLLSRIFRLSWVWHILCALAVLLACVPILWPLQELPWLSAEHAALAGRVVATALGGSVMVLIASCTYFLLHMRNVRAFFQLGGWCAVWAVGVFVFIRMAIEADAPAPYENSTEINTRQTYTIHQPNENLTGPSALVIPISPESHKADVLEQTPNLQLLETQHEELLAGYLEQAPRWAFADKSDTFYTKPGHVVLVPPATGGIPGTVHATFRTVAEGEPMPSGFLPVKPGEPFPEPANDKEELPDIALELSGKHYLLLAWRGTKHRETAHKAINAAIAAIDSRMQKLAETPTEETVARMCRGKIKRLGNTPELHLIEPNNQYGIYQAEVYANPGRPGTLLLAIRDTEGNLLRLFSFPAQYSTNPAELFRHDIPGAVSDWMRENSTISSVGNFPLGAPFFAIKCGDSHQYFEVSVELQFSPSGTDGAVTETLIKRHYKVQAYENTPSE